MFPIDFFWRAVDKYADQIAVAAATERLSFQSLGAKVRSLSNALLEFDPTPQSRVAIGASNSINHLIALLATLDSGKVWVPLNPRNGDPELQRIVEFTEPSILCLDDAMLSRLDTGSATVVLVEGRASMSLPVLSARYAGRPRQRFNLSLGDIQAIKFTGGTTGAPKGVMQPYRAWNAMTVSQWHGFQFNSTDCFLLSAPITHGASTYVIPVLGAGGRLVFPDDAKPATVLNTIAQEGITSIFMPPTAIYSLIHEQHLHPRDVASLRRIIYGGAPMPAGKIREAQQTFGPIIGTTYGQTEAPQIITCLPPEYLLDERNLSSVGAPSLMTDVRIMDKDGHFLPPGEAGEIVVRGDLVMTGYWKMADRTAETIINGWLHTGDIGSFDERGFLFIKDRARDVIITGGFNVYPTDVEGVLGKHPAIFESSVVGIEDEKWGERVCAAVELLPGARATEEEIIQFVKSQIGSVKAPKEVYFIERLPRSPVGKTLKAEVKRQILSTIATAANVSQ
jgi:acyl-CoA synthetase (AMP-forming)/AMP-acid ligase II